MAGTKRKSISKSTPDTSSKKTKSTPDTSSKRKLSDPPVVEELSAKKSNRSKTPTLKIIEQQEQSPALNLTTAEQRQRAIEWAAQSLPNLRKSPKTPASSKKASKERSSSPVVQKAPKEISLVEPNTQKSPEKTISIPAVNTPVPKSNANTAQKRTRVKKVPTTIASSTTTIASSVSSNKAYPLPVPGTAGFVYVVPIIIAAILLWYFSRK